MTELAVEESDWLSATGWECYHDHFIDFPEVSATLSAHLGKIIDIPLSLMYLSGTDMAERCRLYRGMDDGCNGVVVVGRPGGDLDRIKAKKKQWSKDFYLVDIQTEDISSTRIRNLMAKGGDLSALIPKPVAEYIKQKNITCTREPIERK